MKRSFQFITADLRDVHTIVEYKDGTVTHHVWDKITGQKSFLDDTRDECLRILDTDPGVKAYA